MKNSSCRLFLGVIRVSRLPVKFVEMRKVFAKVSTFQQIYARTGSSPFGDVTRGRHTPETRPTTL